MAIFSENCTSLDETATKFFYVKTVSEKVVRHSLSVQEWLSGDVPVKVNFLAR